MAEQAPEVQSGKLKRLVADGTILAEQALTTEKNSQDLATHAVNHFGQNIDDLLEIATESVKVKFTAYNISISAVSFETDPEHIGAVKRLFGRMLGSVASASYIKGVEDGLNLAKNGVSDE